MGAGNVVVDGVSVEECDGEAAGSQLDCQVDGWDHVALERVRDEDRVWLLLVVVEAIFHFLILERERERERRMVNETKLSFSLIRV